MDLRLALRSDDELRRLSRALSLSTQCHLYLALVNAPSVAAPLCELLRDELSLSRKRSIVFERHAPEPTPEAIVTAIEWLDRQGALGRDGVRALDLSAIGDSNAPWLHTLFARLNVSRNALYREPLSEILLIIAPGIEQVFHERAPDFWSIRSGVYPLLAATPADALDRDDDAPRGELSDRARSLVARIEAAQHGDAQERARAFADSTQWLEEQESLSFTHSSDLDAVIDAIAPIVDRDDPPMDWFELLLRATYFGMNALTAAPRRALDVLRRVIESGKLRDYVTNDTQRREFAHALFTLAMQALARSDAGFTAQARSEGELLLRARSTPLDAESELVLALARCQTMQYGDSLFPAAVSDLISSANKALATLPTSSISEDVIDACLLAIEPAIAANLLTDGWDLATKTLAVIEQQFDGQQPRDWWCSAQCSANHASARVLQAQDKHSEALVYANRALAFIRMLVERAPASAEIHFELTEHLELCAELLLSTNQPQEARALLREALDDVEREPLRSDALPLRRETQKILLLLVDARAAVLCREPADAVAAVQLVQQLCSQRLHQAPDWATERLAGIRRFYVRLLTQLHLTEQLRDSDALWLRALRARLALDPSRVEWITHLATELLEASLRDAWNAVEQRSFVHEAIALLRERFEGRDEPRVRALLSALTERESALSQSATAQPAPSNER